MKIGMILDGCDVGDSVTTEGKVTWSANVRHVTGTSNGKPYDFWSQFVVLGDGDEKIGCDLSFKKEADAVSNGTALKLKGILTTYTDKNGDLIKKLTKTSIATNASAQEAPPQQAQQQPAPQGGNNSTPDMIKARSMGLAYAKDLVVAGASKGIESLFPLAQQCTAFITTGNVPNWDPETQPQGKPQPATDDDDDKPW